MTLKELVEAWGGVCIICGHPFESWDCVSREHLKPASLGGSLKDNLAPSHYSCNQVRANNSLMDARMLLLRRERSMPAESFRSWLNKPVPDVEKLIKRFGREHVEQIRFSWNVEKKWPWWKFPQEKKAKKIRAQRQTSD